MKIFNLKFWKFNLYWLCFSTLSCLVGCGFTNNFVETTINSTRSHNSAAAKTQWSNSIMLDLPKKMANNKTSGDPDADDRSKSIYLQAVVATNQPWEAASHYGVIENQPALRSQYGVSEQSDLKNTQGGVTSFQNIEIYRPIKTALMTKGYTISKNPEQAVAVLQVRVKQAGVVNIRVVQHALSKGYGAEILIPDLNTENLVPSISDKQHADLDDQEPGLVKKSTTVKTSRFSVGNLFTSEKPLAQDKVFSLICDVQVLAYQQDVGWMRQQTRVVTTSNKIELPFEELIVALTEYTAKEIAVVF